MMGQELFENPRRQYATFGITALDKLNAVVPDPNTLESDYVTEEQLDAVQAAFSEHEGAVVTFDTAGETWIVGAEEDVEAMFAARDEFLDSLEAGHDPGL